MRARGCARWKKLARPFKKKKKRGGGPSLVPPRARSGALSRRSVSRLSAARACLHAEGAPQNRPNAFFFFFGGGACFLPKREPPEAFVAFFFGAGVPALNLTVPGRW